MLQEQEVWRTGLPDNSEDRGGQGRAESRSVHAQITLEAYTYVHVDLSREKFPRGRM